LLASYRYLVRSTFIGQVLNGRRYPRGSAGTSPRDGDASRRVSAASSSATASLADVHKRYGAIVALDGVTLDVEPGELVALLGPNGAGKSTAIGLWLGLHEPDRGKVSLFGRSPID